MIRNDNTETKKIQNFLNEIGFMFEINNWKANLILSHNKEGKYAEITVHRKYREIDLRLFDEFFGLGRREKADVLIHELCHVYTIPQKLIAASLLEGSLHTNEQIAEVNEEETSVFARIISRLLMGELMYARNAYRDFVSGRNRSKKNVI